MQSDKKKREKKMKKNCKKSEKNTATSHLRITYWIFYFNAK